MAANVSVPADKRDAHRRPAWIPTIAAFACIAAFVTAGNWQHRRMLEKEALQASIAAAAAAPESALPRDGGDWSAWRFRVVTMTGEFDAGRQMLVDNVVRAGRAGFGVVTPLRLVDGRTVLVDRGWIAIGVSRSALPSVPVPTGAVRIRGRVDVPPRRYPGSADAPPVDGVLWQHVDPQRFGQAAHVPVLPIIVRELGPGDDGLLRTDALPDTGVEKHVGYMVQWYTFAAMAAALWLWFTVRPWIRRARRG
jgi:surfeit locus 1 family protein